MGLDGSIISFISLPIFCYWLDCLLIRQRHFATLCCGAGCFGGINKIYVL